MSVESIQDLFDLLAQRGSGRYGLSGVNQLEHALQSAALAQSEGADDALVIAALFHDIGHLQTPEDSDLAADGIDDRHEVTGAALLQRLFGSAVAEPVRLHVEAKRLLCAREPDYYDGLSEDSRRSLVLQGGPMDEETAERFLAEPAATAAIQLRRYDDRAKIRGLEVPPLASYQDLADRLMLEGAIT